MTAQPKAKKETTMAEKQELSVREKKELVAKEEKTIPGRYYVPYADIYETDDALAVVLEMPGVEKKDLNVALENDVLRVDGQIDFSKYKEMEPVYTEYNIGHYARIFTLSNKVDQDKISANLEDGVLTLTLPKAKPPSRGRSRSAERRLRTSWCRVMIAVRRCPLARRNITKRRPLPVAVSRGRVVTSPYCHYW